MPADQAQQYDVIGVKGVIGFYFQALEQISANLWSTRLANEFTSTQDTETYAGLGNVPQLREWIGGKQPNSFTEQSLKITNKDWESTIRIKNKDRRRDKTGILSARMGQLAERALMHNVKLLSNIIDSGSGTTVATAYDGKALFATNHSVGKSGTTNNAISVTIASLPTGDVTGSHGSTTNPSVGEMALSIQKGIKQIYGFLDDQGEPINETAQEFDIMVPVGLSDAASAALSSVYLAQGMSNPTLTQMGPNGTTIKRNLIVNPRLTSTTKFYVFRSDGFFKPLIIQQEMAPIMKALAEGSDNEFMNNEVLFSIEKSGNVGIGRFDQACQVTLA